MKAAYYKKSGGPEVLDIVDLAKPEPGPGEILVKVMAATVTRGDAVMRRMPRLLLSVVGLIAGFKPMSVPGVEFSGVIETIGPGVNGYQTGDHVTGTTTGLAHGANAEYVCVPVNGKSNVVVHKPAGVDFAQSAAASVGGMTAVQLLNKAGLTSGESILVYGASGSVGISAVQIARHMGAQVTAVCSTTNLEMVISAGAEKAIDYTTTDINAIPERFDVVFDAVGKFSKGRAKGLLKPGGRYTSIGVMTKEVTEELAFVQELLASGKFQSFIEKTFSLEDIRQAHALVDSGRKKGNVVITPV